MLAMLAACGEDSLFCQQMCTAYLVLAAVSDSNQGIRPVGYSGWLSGVRYVPNPFKVHVLCGQADSIALLKGSATLQQLKNLVGSSLHISTLVSGSKVISLIDVLLAQAAK